MIQKIFLCGAAFVFLSVPTTKADEESEVAKTGFAAADWTLNQLTRMELNEQGQLRLKRDHWELASKRTLPKPKQDSPFIARQRPDRNAEAPAVDKLFNRLAAETGGRRGSSSSSNGQGRTISFSSKSLKATLSVTADSIGLDVDETVDDRQSLRLTDEENTTRLIFRSPSSFVEILRSRDSVHVCSIIDGQVSSWTGHSFAEVVQQHEDYFRDTLQPVLGQITQLPLNEALEAKVTTSDKPVSFEPMEFKAGTLTEAAIGEAFSALVRFRLVEGRLRINRFFGDRTILKQEVEKVSAEFQKSLDEAVARLKKLDASNAMISKLKSELNWQRDTEQPALNGGRIFGRMFGGQAEQADQSDSLLESYDRMQSLAHRGGSHSSSRGGSSYSSSFSAGHISASIRRTTDGTSLQAKDSAVEIVVQETEDLFELEIESSTGLLVIDDRPGRSCSVLLVGGGECEFMQSDSFVALVNEHHEKYRDRILPILNRYNISGLDPLGKDAVDAILQRLPKVPNGMLDIETAVGKTDAYAFPLLNDAIYLNILASRLQGDDQSAVKARADSLTSPQNRQSQIPMPIDVKCQHCSKAYRLKDELNGKKFKCRECGKVTIANPVGAEAPSAAPKKRPPKAPVAEAASPRRKKKPTAPLVAQPVRQRPKKKPPAKKRPSNAVDDYEMYDDGDDFLEDDDFADDYGNDDFGDDAFGGAPARKKKSSKSKGGKKKKKKSGGGMAIGFNTNAFNIGMVIGAIAICVAGVRESKLSAKAKPEPTQITLADLNQNGYGDNIYLTVTDVQPASDDGEFVYEERPEGSGKYTKAWIPCKPTGAPGKRSRFILYSTSAKNDGAIDQLMTATSHTGMVTNDIRKLGREELNLLNSIQGVNAGDATIFEVGRKPSAAGLVVLYFIGALLLLLGGLAWIFFVPGD